MANDKEPADSQLEDFKKSAKVMFIIVLRVLPRVYTTVKDIRNVYHRLQTVSTPYVCNYSSSVQHYCSIAALWLQRLSRLGRLLTPSTVGTYCFFVYAYNGRIDIRRSSTSKDCTFNEMYPNVWLLYTLSFLFT